MYVLHATPTRRHIRNLLTQPGNVIPELRADFVRKFNRAEHTPRYRYGLHGTYWGGPPWPPVVCATVQEATASKSANTIKTTGGHGGPPLQYAPWLTVSFC